MAAVQPENLIPINADFRDYYEREQANAAGHGKELSPDEALRSYCESSRIFGTPEPTIDTVITGEWPKGNTEKVISGLNHATRAVSCLAEMAINQLAFKAACQPPVRLAARLIGRLASY